MLKKISRLFILCALGLGFMWFVEGEDAQAASSINHRDQSDGSFSYKISKDSKYVIITGFDDTYKIVTVPNTIIGLPVKEIANEAFLDNTMTDLTLQEGITSIGDYSFVRTTSLKRLNLPISLESIGKYAFEGSGIEVLVLPNNMKKIGDFTFIEAKALKNITLPNSLETIGVNAFAGSGIEKLILPNSVLKIEEKAFASTTGLKHITLSNSLINMGEFIFTGSGIEEIVLPNSITKINSYTFNGANNLKSILIPRSVIKIDPKIFENVPIGFKYKVFENSYAATFFLGSPDLQYIHEVKYETSGGDPLSGVVVDKGTIISAPSTPIKTNHRFEGWYTDSTFITKRDFLLPVTESMTLYAKWISISEVTYDSNQGSAVSKEIVDTGKVVAEPTPPTKANLRFAGWYTDVALTIPWNFATDTITGNMTLYAKWVYVPNVSPPAEILELSNIGDNATGIQGTVSPNSYIQIVLNGTELANGRADNEGRFNIEIPTLLAGTELKMIVTNAFGSKKIIFLKVVDHTAPKVTLKPFSDKDTKITGKTEPKAKVKIYMNGKLVKTITADANGNYSYTVPKKKAGTVIKVIATDLAGNATTKSFKVLDKTAPAKPIVKAPTTNTTTLTGKAEKGSTVYVYKNNRVIAKVKVDSKGNYSLKIKKQKIGTTLTLIVRDQAKNTSKKTSIKVKKA